MLDRMLNSIAPDTDNGCVWAGMGLGKTVVGLTYAEEMLRAKEAKKVLIVSTKKAAEHTWAGECTEWDHLAHQADYTHLLFGNPAQRAAKLGKQGIHIINQENLPWLVAGYGQKWPYDMVLIDDCKGFKRASSHTFMAMRHVLPKVNHLKFLNGTPMPNGYRQLWPQIFCVDKGKRLFRTYGEYERHYFQQEPYGYKWTFRGDRDKQDIDQKLLDIAFSVDIEDYLEVPAALNPPPITAKLPTKLRKQYDQLEEDFFVALEHGEEVEALSAANLQGKLAQFSNGAIYTDPGNAKSDYVVIHDLKLELLREVVEESNGENLIVAYNFRSDWERVKKAFPKAVHVNDGPNVVKKWNKGEIAMLCCHPASAGHGLNLQYGGRTIVWFGSEWSLELNQQMQERVGAVRQMQSGLNRKPRYLRLAIEGTVEQDIANSIRNKAKEQSDLMDYVKMGRESRATRP